jgi:hypothetical protein
LERLQLSLGVKRQYALLMERAHAARIHWSAEQRSRGLPTAARATDPAWFDGDPAPGRPDAEGWSLVCEFASAPSEQGDPSAARVRFLVPDAPHERLRPGARLRMIERGTGQLAVVEILD